MKASYGEIKICEIFDRAGVIYQEEYTFPDLVATSGHPLRFDFAVFDDEGNLDFLVEYQGAQHYEASGKFGGSKALYKQRHNDMEKVKYCQRHNIPLVIVPYWDFGILDYDYIFSKAGY